MKRTLTALTLLALAAGPVYSQQAENTAPAETSTAITFSERQDASQVLATDFTGEPVVNAAGEPIGDINNLVFDESGRISLAVIGVGGFMGVGEKEVAVPFDALRPDTRDGKRVLVIDVTKEQIQSAPHYQTLNDQRFAERMAAWKEKAKAGWNRVSEEAKQAYEQAKTAVKSASQKAEEADKAAENAEEAAREADQAAEAAKSAERAAEESATPPAKTN